LGHGILCHLPSNHTVGTGRDKDAMFMIGAKGVKAKIEEMSANFGDMGTLI
jgi:hypothetical protein